MRSSKFSPSSGRKSLSFWFVLSVIGTGAFLSAFLLFRESLQVAIKVLQIDRHCDGVAVAVAVPSPSPKLRILLGVFSMASKVERRNLMRIAYGVQHSDQALVTLRFVIGKPNDDVEALNLGLESLHHGDLLILNCTENMNHGKSFMFWDTVATAGPEYDYVMKVDDDSYVRVDNLANSLVSLPRTDLYYGYVLPCENQDPYAWYMAGMGYLLSWDLVQWVHDSPIPRNATEGTEDELMGGWLNKGEKAKNRVSKKPLFYDHPDFGGKCSHELIPETILIHQVKNEKRWHDVLSFFERHRIAALSSNASTPA